MTEKLNLWYIVEGSNGHFSIVSDIENPKLICTLAPLGSLEAKRAAAKMIAAAPEMLRLLQKICEYCNACQFDLNKTDIYTAVCKIFEFIGVQQEAANE